MHTLAWSKVRTHFEVKKKQKNKKNEKHWQTTSSGFTSASNSASTIVLNNNGICKFCMDLEILKKKKQDIGNYELYFDWCFFYKIEINMELAGKPATHAAGATYRLSSLAA